MTKGESLSSEEGKSPLDQRKELLPIQVHLQIFLKSKMNYIRWWTLVKLFWFMVMTQINQVNQVIMLYNLYNAINSISVTLEKTDMVPRQNFKKLWTIFEITESS